MEDAQPTRAVPAGRPGRHARPAGRHGAVAMLDGLLGMVALPALAAGAAVLTRALLGSLVPGWTTAGVACPGGELGLAFGGALAVGVVIPFLALVAGVAGTVRGVVSGSPAWPWVLGPALVAGIGVVAAPLLWPACLG